MEHVIPIQNLYFIFCYAWRRLEESKAVDVGGVDSELFDLFATVLIAGVRRLMRRVLDPGYIPFIEQLSALRGRIQIYESMKLLLRKAPELICEYDRHYRIPGLPNCSADGSGADHLTVVLQH